MLEALSPFFSFCFFKIVLYSSFYWPLREKIGECTPFNVDLSLSTSDWLR